MYYHAKKILSKEELNLIADTIAKVEKTTVGEIRVSIQKERSMADRKLSVYDLAVKHFYSLEMEKTKEKTGVLLYLLLSDKKFYILGDEGINKKVTEEFWKQLASELSHYFHDKKFVDGICYAIHQVGDVLKKEFPIKPGDTNELSNEVNIS